MKTKTFNFSDADVDSQINDFLAKYENDLDPKGMYIDVSSRIVFVYDDEDLDLKAKRGEQRVLREKFLNEAVRLIGLEQQTWEAKRGFASGTVKQEDLDRITNEESVCRAKIDYLKEKLNGFVENG